MTFTVLCFLLVQGEEQRFAAITPNNRGVKITALWRETRQNERSVTLKKTGCKTSPARIPTATVL